MNLALNPALNLALNLTLTTTRLDRLRNLAPSGDIAAATAQRPALIDMLG